MKGAQKKSKKMARTKEFCPACGSTNIGVRDRQYTCLNCGAIFSTPKRATVKLMKRPRYIG